MTQRPCEKCLEPSPVRLQHASEGSYVTYYRCGRCWHVFHVPNEDLDGPRTDVTRPVERGVETVTDEEPCLAGRMAARP